MTWADVQTWPMEDRGRRKRKEVEDRYCEVCGSRIMREGLKPSHYKRLVKCYEHRGK